jgi:SecD/SecF fusion protein
MKANVGRVILCLVPVVLAAGVVGWASYRYEKGRGGFRLGVDLVGGTILVYEVDRTRQTQDVKPEDLAAALKRRIDPADLYNVTIRPVQGDPPRVEIILPTGGVKQRNAEVEAWHALVNDLFVKFPSKPEGTEGNPYEKIPVGHKEELERAVIDLNKGTDPKEISDYFAREYQVNAGDRRALTSEEVENIKNLIGQQGRLEFRILANSQDDRDALDRAKAWVENPDNAAKLRELSIIGLPPPPPEAEGGGLTFPVTLQNETHNYSYSWVEVGKEELYSLHLNNAAENDPAYGPSWKRVAEARNQGKTLPWQGNTLLYSRKIENPERLTPKDKAQGKKYEYFILSRNTEPGKEITGDYLSGARRAPDEHNRWAVHFSFNTQGANLFYELTSLNKPTGGENGFHRLLAIILDGQVRSAPRLNQPIRSQGQITGEFTAKAVDELVTILRAGALPATLLPQPVSENTMGATLGQDTIDRGTRSVLWAFFAVLAFMVVYYRFAGFVACVALLANLLLTVAFMVLVNATFTLPGLAGLVLMLGMAVDANVLIYERLREERERGASLPLAIRNGYDRAFPTIIDTHLSSIFTAIVLYVVGNDQLKGFGISLTVGLIISLFTSLYMTRTIFDLWQAKHWLKKLSFLQLFHRPNIDFMAIRYYWFTATIVLTILGAGLFVWRLPGANAEANESSVMNIDFTGGTNYTGRLAKPMTITQLREALKDCGLPDLSIEQVFTGEDTGERDPASGEPTSRLFSVRTGERRFDVVQKVINDRLGDVLDRVELRRYEIAKDNKTVLLEFAKPHQEGAAPEPGYASRAQVTNLLGQKGLKGFTLQPDSEEKDGRFSKMKLVLGAPVERTDLEKILSATKKAFDDSPQPERLENFDKQLATNTQEIALYAILASWAAILLYLWFRFGSWTFGAAAVLCLIHDLFFTLGVIAAAHYVYGTGFGNLLGIRDFKIDLPTVAALLTLVGYSVNDTIVVFDRIREVRGKNPALTPQMINDSVNQTLSRTVLSALSVWLVVIVLYIAGGEGLHLFAFVMVAGVIVGTYSSIYIASPLLLIFGEGSPRHTDRPRVQTAPTQA